MTFIRTIFQVENSYKIVFKLISSASKFEIFLFWPEIHIIFRKSLNIMRRHIQCFCVHTSHLRSATINDILRTTFICTKTSFTTNDLPTLENLMSKYKKKMLLFFSSLAFSKWMQSIETEKCNFSPSQWKWT